MPRKAAADRTFESYSLPAAEDVFETSRRATYMLFGVVAVVAFFAFFWAQGMVGNARQVYFAQARGRLVVSGAQVAGHVSAWAGEQARMARLLGASPVWADMLEGHKTQNTDKALTVIDRATPLGAQGFDVLLLNTGLQPVWHTGSTATKLAPDTRAMAARVIKSGAGTLATLPLVWHEGHMVLRQFVPVVKGHKVQGVLLLGSGFDAHFVNGPLEALRDIGTHSQLVELTSQGFALLAPRGLYPVPEGRVGRLFDLRPAITGTDRPAVYSVATPVEKLPWLFVVQSTDKDTVMAPIRQYALQVYAVVGLGALVVMLLVAAVSARMASVRNRFIAAQYRSFARHIDDQHQVLVGINNTLSDHLALRGQDGAFVYVNPAFETFWDVKLDDLRGLRPEDIFPPETAAFFTEGDIAVANGQGWHAANIEVPVAGQTRILRVDRNPLYDARQGLRGSITLARDITEFVGQKRKINRMRDETVETLVRAIEVRDPHLAGHADRMATLAEKVGEGMGLSADDLLVLRFGAHLSGIGKVFIDRDILTKPGKLTAKEQKELHKHVEYAQKILGGSQFELPVENAVCQMSERMDGSGYPDGLKGAQISIHARILGLCDVFCALVAPRAYRDALHADEALALMEKDRKKFDPEALATLATLAEGLSPAAVERLLEGLGAV